MKFGVSLPNFGKYAERDYIIEIARTAEDLGFDSLWVSDHIIIPHSHKGFGEVFYEPLVTLAYIASHTNKIHLGTSVIILPYRNPIVLAKTISTLDVLSGGRVIFGMGAGWLKEEFLALGASYEERGSITDEWIEVLKLLWTEERPVFKGRYHEFSDISFLPRPIQKPHPPIWVGGNSRKAVERAVSCGDGWHPVGLIPEEIAEKADYLDEMLAAKMKKRSEFVISLRKNLQVFTGRKLDVDVKDERETLRGTREKIIKGLEQYGRAGVSHLVFQVLSGDLKGIVETMKIFSKDIGPAFKP
ncbi:MAG TPA: LLM class F420-dependent oxidoreductase [Thermodesulfobacteriota bacterium]|nr:LLM class F420-dependent oxidoreductase [Thermodesulfobacteriota bacterium]